MSPITHLLISWSVANTGRTNQRERALITVAGVIPDIDGLGIVADFLTRNSENPLEWWEKYHHILGHNIGFALLTTACVFLLSTRRYVSALLAFLSIHIHLFCDVIGSRGPEGYQWPIPYLQPFSNVWQIAWKGQWALNAWPNFVITGAAICIIFYLAWKRGYSPLEMVSSRADQAFVETLRKRFGNPH